MSEGERHSARADYHLVCLAEFGKTPEPESWDERAVLLVGKDHSGFLLRTGCSSGRVWVTVRGVASPPAAPLAEELKEWEVAQEETLTIAGELTLISPLGGGPFVERVFVPEQPGLHRVRARARGRGRNWDLATENPVEEYDVTLWPVTAIEPGLLLDDEGLT